MSGNPIGNLNRSRGCRTGQICCRLLLACCLLLAVNLWSGGKDALALTGEEVLVVYNRRMAEAEDIAEYYLTKREIPPENLLKLSLSVKETISREEFEDDLLLPVRSRIEELTARGRLISALVLIYGMPLKVEPPQADWQTREVIESLKKERERLQQEDKSAKSEGATLGELSKRITALAGTNKRAAVDSELMVVKKAHYELDGWLENPYFPGFHNKTTLLSKNDVLVVARLDGPDAQTVYRLIDDTLATEQKGLTGKAYFDARWPLPLANDKSASGYRLWDASLHRAAALVGKRLVVKLDDRQELLPPGSAPDAALYGGWYSLGKYVDSFTWVKGAVGYHIASAECSTLKKKDSQVWCVQMLNHGVAATLGPVYEPYVQGFPLPEIFFGALVEGYMDLGEAYLVSLPYVSWQMVLVGDPLYRPFKPLPSSDRQ